MELYKPEKSKRKNKKFMVKTKKGIIHFGDSRYEDFTQHKDEKRREAYCKRSKGIKDKEGKLTYNNKDSANYWSRKILWDC
jgi:TFIIF-interacting CTD phosphatase-like protein